MVIGEGGIKDREGISAREYSDYFEVGRPASCRWCHSLVRDPELHKNGESKLCTSKNALRLLLLTVDRCALLLQALDIATFYHHEPYYGTMS